MPRQARVIPAAFLAWAILSPALGAQVVVGKTVLAGTEETLSDVTVRLLFPDGRQASYTVTDSAGKFVMTVPRSAIELGLLTGYYERMERQQRLGFGHFLTRDQIEDRQALDVADLLRDIPRVRVVQRGSGSGRLPSVVFLGAGGECSPAVFIDGIRQNRGGAAGTAAVVDETLRPYDLEGIEVYRGITEMAAEFYDEQHCGLILLWTRRDMEEGHSLSLNRIMAAFGLFLTFVFLLAK